MSDFGEVLSEAEAQAKVLATPRVPRKSLAEFARDTNSQNVLIKGRWGVRGSISMHISTTGSGKSVLQTQAALCFNRGLPCCGLEPTRPFRTWIIQSEDDDDRVAIDRDDILAHLREQYPDQDWDEALRQTVFLDFTGKTGVAFIETLNAELSAVAGTPDMPDGVILNPWNKFFGGDPMSHKDCSAFLAGGELGRQETEGIEAVIKRHGVWLWAFSHTGKPPTNKELKEWLADPYSCYKMCGSSAVPDAVRSIITFLRVPDHDGIFTFTAGKNGSGLEWLDGNGKRTTRSYFAWGDQGRHYWRDLTPDEVAALGGGSKMSDEEAMEKAVTAVVSAIKAAPVAPLAGVNAIEVLVPQTGLPRAVIRRAIAAVTADPDAHRLTVKSLYHAANRGWHKHIGLAASLDAAKNQEGGNAI